MCPPPVACNQIRQKQIVSFVKVQVEVKCLCCLGGVTQQGRSAEAEAEFERLLGGSHVKYAMLELSKFDRGDDADTVKLSELLYGCHFRGRYYSLGFLSSFLLA